MSIEQVQTGSWEELIPAQCGVLPGGEPLRRTDPNGVRPAKVALLGLYPALSKKRLMEVAGTRMWLPTEVERYSFEAGSASGAEIEKNYLEPLGLTRSVVCLLDLLPYFFANTARSTSGRSMAGNVAAYEHATGTQTGILPRPAPAVLVPLASTLPGNTERLRHYLSETRPELVLTLGVEAAAIVRGLEYPEANARLEQLLYAEACELDVFGVNARVVHVVHPHMFIKQKLKWMNRHQTWCAQAGLELIASQGEKS